MWNTVPSEIKINLNKFESKIKQEAEINWKLTTIKKILTCESN